MNRKVERGKRKALLLTAAILLLGSGMAHAQAQGGVKVRGNIFGGGEAASVNGNTTVYIHGSENDTVRGSVYGGGEGRLSAADEATVHNTTVTIAGGNVKNNVFGGGKGADTDADLARSHNSEVNVSGTGQVHGNVYGGGEMASVGVLNSTGTEFQAGTGLAKVNISGGRVGDPHVDELVNVGYVFGGGLGFAGGGSALDFANVDSTKVTISGGTIVSSVFGGGDNGHVWRSTVINMTGGVVGQHNTLAQFVTDEYDHAANHIYTGSVLGGGRGTSTVNNVAGQYNDTTGIVFGNTTVNISGGNIHHAVYGGGGLSSIGTFTIDNNGIHHFQPNTGKTTVNISGNALVGPSKDDLIHPIHDEMIALGIDSASYVDSVFKYLGGNSGWVFGAGCGLAGSPYNVLTFNDSAVVNISGGDIVSSVYGGGENGHVQGHTKVTISGGTIGAVPIHGDTLNPVSTYEILSGPYAGVTVHLSKKDAELGEDKYGAGRRLFRGEVYGGGKGTDLTESNEYSLTAGRVYGNTNVIVTGGNIYKRVYGGGSLASVGTYTENPAGSIVPFTLTSGGTANVTVSGGNIGDPNHLNGVYGGVFGGGRGLAGKDSSQEVKLAYVGNTNVNISGTAAIANSVYGGSANGHVRGDAFVHITGGTIGTANCYGWHSNVYGGGGGSGSYKDGSKPKHLSITAGRVFGNTKVVIEGGTIHNNVYGGGALASVGTYDLRPAVTDTIISNTAIDSVIVLGGTIGVGDGKGNVFGSARGTIDVPGAFLDSLSYAAQTRVIIGNTAGTATPQINGSVYGSGENGHVFWDAIVRVLSGTVEQNVFGAGSGTDRYDLSDTTAYNPIGGIARNTEVSIRGGLVKGDVFGGGEMASVQQLAKVEVSGNGTVGVEADISQSTTDKGSVYGGSLGKTNAAYNVFANVGRTDVDITGGYVVNSVFGGGRNGIVLTNTDVTVSDTALVGLPLTLAQRTADANEQVPLITSGNVYGGGRGSDTDNNGDYSITAGHVQGNTNVTISGGTVRHAVYGGGAMGTVGTCTLGTDGLPTGDFADNTGLATVTVSGGLIGPKVEDLVTSSSTAADIDAAFKVLGVNEGNVFGSSRGLAGPLYRPHAYVDSTVVVISDNAQVVGSVFGGGENGHVYNGTNVVVSGGTIGGIPLHGDTLEATSTYAIVGGEYDGVTVHLSKADAELKEDAYGTGRHIFRGEVYGAGKGTDFIQGSIGHYSPSSGRVYGNTHVTVSGGTIYNKVYGGGSLASVGTYSENSSGSLTLYTLESGGMANVTVSGGQIGSVNTDHSSDGRNNGDVYGGGRGLVGSPSSEAIRKAYVANTNVVIESGAAIASSVYGGAANGHVLEDTKVTVNGGTIGTPGLGRTHSNVYGGGGGAKRYIDASNHERLSITAGRVFGNTEVNINGGMIYHNVYGGGAIASVGTYDLSGVPNPLVDNTGVATINILGGQIGTDGDNNGHVFGSARGEIDTIGHFLDSLSYLGYTYVNIGKDNSGTYEGNAVIKGSVYGSGENGHVFAETHVNVYKGTIGVHPNDSDYTTSIAGSKFQYRGNVYGAGCGTDIYDESDPNSYNPQSGIVWGNTNVDIYGGYISRNVYGGGAMASVGNHTATLRHSSNNTAVGDTLSWPAELNFLMGGTATVNIHGGHIGTVEASDISGDVYGSSRGEAGNRYVFAPLANAKETYVNVNFTTPTDITIADGTANCIVGSVYGSGENGHVYDSANVHIVSGLIGGSVFGGGKGTDMYRDSLWIADGLGGHTTKLDTLVHSITAGKVYGNTFVTVDGGIIKDNVYGGGNLASVGKSNYKGYGEDGSDEAIKNSGQAYVTINGGTIGTETWADNGHVFGSSKGITFPTVRETPRYLYSHDFFLGYTNRTYVTIGDNTHTPTVYGSVFGGGENGHVRMNTEVTVNSGTIGLEYDPSTTTASITDDEWKLRGNVYGAGRGIDTIANTTRFCNSAGSVTDTTHVIVNGGTIYRSVYGGGSLATVGPPPGYDDPSISIVDILGGTIGSTTGVTNQYGGDVYGSSRGEIAPIRAQHDTLATVLQAVVNIGASTGTHDPLVNGSVYGSGENGHVTTNATVNIFSGRVGDSINQVTNSYCGNVFGAGRGTDTIAGGKYNPIAGIVKGNTFVNIYGGSVMRSVYGGGEMASVGTITDSIQHVATGSDAHHVASPFLYSWPYEFTYKAGTGYTHVNVFGGRIGITGKDGPTDDTEVDNGDIYGGSKGTVGDRYEVAHLANVDSTFININYSDHAATPTNYKTNRELQCITGAVYGGGENGHVNGSTVVTLRNGLVGHAVYGGGKGKDQYNGQYDPNAGKVYGNTHISIEGRHRDSLYVVRSVFGGGNLASVGVGNYAGGVGDYNVSTGYGELVTNSADWADTANTGHTYIEVIGGTLGMLNASKPDKAFKDNIPYGSVFGGSRGMAVRDVLVSEIGDLYGNRPDVFTGFVNHTHVKIGEADGSSNGKLHVYGSVYGGAQDGHVRWNTNVTVNSGEIGVAPSETALMGNSDYNSIHWTARGNVFGAGSGIGQYDTIVGGQTVKKYSSLAGSVTQKVDVTINGGTIHRNVYGGGDLATVGPPHFGDDDCPNTLTGIVVNINSNIGVANEQNYGGFVYGGSRGMTNPDSGEVMQFKKFAFCSYAEVNIGKEDGSVSPVVTNSVFGGGENGQMGLDAADAQPIHNTVVNLYDNATIAHSVYGGGQGVYGEDGFENDTVSGYIMGSTFVNLYGGTVNDVYGGSRRANILANTNINIGQDNAGVYEGNVVINGNVYGANNYNGSPFGHVNVNVYATAHGADPAHNLYPENPPAPYTQWTSEALHENGEYQTYAINRVFGGGNKANYLPRLNGRANSGKTATVHVYGCENTIREVFGGANAAHIGTTALEGNSHLIVDGGRIYRAFGGGNGEEGEASTYGMATTEIRGGLIDLVFGGGNKNGSVLETNLIINDYNVCAMLVDSIFGGSNEAPINGDVNTTLAGCEGDYENIYGGANNADITGSVTLNILGNTIGNVFGGSKGSPSVAANIDGDVTLNLHGGHITNAFGGSDMNGNITGIVTVNVLDTVQDCPLYLDTLYGGSRNTHIVATYDTILSPVVNLLHGTVNTNVYGGSKGITASVVSNPVVNIGDNVVGHVALVKGNVFGGGESASLTGNTTVNINSGTVGVVYPGYTQANTTYAVYDTLYHGQNVTGHVIDPENSGKVFGGGQGTTENKLVAYVTGNTTVNINGGRVLQNVYGGGEVSSVSDTAFVNVYGGQIGSGPMYLSKQGSSASANDSICIPIALNGTDGYVFGGGQGIGDDEIVWIGDHYNGTYYNYANVGTTVVTIDMPMPVNAEDSINNRLWGSVFGGAEDGHVIGNTHVHYVNGLMGTTGTTSYDGNIFGGGRNYWKKNYTAGRVGGNANVEMSGGQILGSIFGGGRLGLVGMGEKGATVNDDGYYQAMQDGDHGNIRVEVSGGTVGNGQLVSTWTKSSMGDVYGGGKGTMDSVVGHPAASALLISLAKNTEVVISGDARIYGSVFGGGEVANVGNYTWHQSNELGIHDIELRDENSGLARVTVSGGTIGADNMQMRYDLSTDPDHPYDLRYNDDVGHVFGGGEGIAANPGRYATVNPASGTAGVHNNVSLLDIMASVGHTEVTISDSAFVKGSVYGGAENGHLMHGAQVTVSGGQIGCGEGMDRPYTETEFATSTSLAECVHWNYGGNFDPFDQFDVAAGQYPSDGKTWFGNVFGGGSGYYPYVGRTLDNLADSLMWNPVSGRVEGSTKVIITGGHILSSVYGGCETTDVWGDSTIVTMSGGTIGVPRTYDDILARPVVNYLFGAGKGDPRTNFNTWTNVNNVRVDVSGGWIYGSVFGGGEEGHVINNAKVTIRGNKGTNAEAIAGEATKIGTFGYTYVDGNVFGAGRGFSGEALTAGVVGGNTTVNVKGGEVLGSVYGGGRLASVGTYFVDPSSVLYGQMQSGDDHGRVTVNISGGVIGNDYESVFHHKDHNYGGNVFGGSMGRLTQLDGTTVNTLWPDLAKVKSTDVNVSGTAVIKGNVYGGGELGTVDETAAVSVSGGTIWRDVYGGSFGSDSTNCIGNLTYIRSDNGQLATTTVTPMYWAGRVKGNTDVDISGGWIKKSVYGGGELASVGYYADTTKHTASHPFNLSWPFEFIYKAGSGATHIDITGGRIGITGKDYMGPWIYGGVSGDSLIPWNVSTNTALTAAEIAEAEEDNGDVYGGCKGKVFERYLEALIANVDTTYVNINITGSTATPQTYKKNLDLACIAGAVYGGGENGHVNHHTNVTLNNGLIGHAVYGGGKGKGKYKDPDTGQKVYSITAGKVYGNTHVTVNGGNVVRSVYGGGNLGSVGIGNYAAGVGDYNQAGYGELVTDAAQWADTANSGHTYVNIYGGTLGMLDENKPEKTFKENVPYGSVFGGCRGLSVSGEWDSLGFVNYTHVTIGESVGSTGPRLYGSVYGGAQDGHVRWDANTVINSGEIGVDLGGSETAMVGSTNVDTIYWVARGNVYGGGSGIGTYETYTPNALNPSVNDTIQNLSHIAGSVLRNVNLTVNGGTIHRNVYGGGNLATVGPRRFGDHDATIDQTCVTVNINAPIGQNTDMTTHYGGHVYGGSMGRANADSTYAAGFEYEDFAYVPYTKVNLNDGANVPQDVFGGGENGQVGTTHVIEKVHTTEVTVNDGATVGGNVFGGGQGAWGNAYYLNDTISGRVIGNTLVTVNDGGVVNGNLYGGGALGIVMDSARVTINGGTVNNVFGAGQGHIGAGQGYATGELSNADVAVATQVNLNAGTVLGNVYGGGENGSIGFLKPEGITPTATVNLNGGEVTHSAFGGGMLGYTDGNTFVNISGDAVVDEKVFGGAYGSFDTVYVAGLRTVNMRGGTVKGSVYGGSYQANDALSFVEYTPAGFDASQDTARACVVNISGGYAQRHVFGAGYFGKTYGSTYVFIGTNAVMNAPHHTGSNNAGNLYNASFFNDHNALRIRNDVFAGADYGSLDNPSSVFGPHSITGRSDVYIDGLGYNTQAGSPTGENNYMVLESSSVFGCGTRQDGGKNGRRIMVRNYGHDNTNPDQTGDDKEPYKNASRSLYSFQYADSLILENTHVNLIGLGKVNVFAGTEEYSIWTIDSTVRLVNGSSIYIDQPVRNIGSLHSNYRTGDMYAAAPTYQEVNYDGLDPTNRDNKIRINQGTNVTVIHLNTTDSVWYYGALRGFFHMMTDGNYNAFAYARPKHSEDAANHNAVEEPYDNPTDGGFVSYLPVYNIYDLDGAVDSTYGIQMPYENHTPTQNRNGELYFRVWRYRALGLSRFDIVLHALAQAGSGYYLDWQKIDNLPAGSANTRYRIKNVDGAPSINYGSEVRLVNAGFQEHTASPKWMYYDSSEGEYVYGQASVSSSATSFMTAHPNNVFGLTMIPTFNTDDNGAWLICNEANGYLADNQTVNWLYDDASESTGIDFVLTHSKAIDGNFKWDPIAITLEQVDPIGNVVGEILINVTINTVTSIEQPNNVKTYALMTHATGYGDPTDVFSAKVVLPPYKLAGAGLSEWTLDSVVWKPNFPAAQLVEGDTYLSHTPDTSIVGMWMYPTRNFDNISGWDDEPTNIDRIDLATKLTTGGTNPIITPISLGATNGINPIAFNFDLHYDSDQNVGEEGNAELGVVEVFTHITNYDTPEGIDVKFFVKVLRRGKGRGYYVDGEHGDFAYSGRFPNASQPSVAGIFYFADPPFEPSDTIYIVNKVTANSAKALNWNGLLYDQLKIYRYNGGHRMFKGEAAPETPFYTAYGTSEYRPNNEAYKGVLVDVVNSMTINSTIIDGAYGREEGMGIHYDDGNGTHVNDSVVVDAPIFHVHNGATLTIAGGYDSYSSVRNNYNTGTDGGAILIAPGGTLNLGEDTRVNGNTVTGEHHGGGIYMGDRAHLVVSDTVNITGNKNTSSLAPEKEENVYIATYPTYISIGDSPLHATSRIGVTKTDWQDQQLMPIVYAENVNYLDGLLDGVVDRRIVFDDMHRDTLLKYPLRYSNGDPDRLNKLYYVRTWVDVVTEAPSGFNKDDIDTPEELAWAISVVNGLNGEEAQPATNFTVTKDIDMSRYIWVPIGTSSHPYSRTFEGNGHLVSGIHSPLSTSNKGIFGVTNGATIQNLQADASFYYGIADTVGGIVANMKGESKIVNCEQMGYLETSKGAIGGLAGRTSSASVIHSSFAVDTLNGTSTGVLLGGLVGTNSGDLYNSYSNFKIDTINLAYHIGGLAGNNTGHIENCYVQAYDSIHTVTNTRVGWLAYNNLGGEIWHCYIPADYNTKVPGSVYLNGDLPVGEGVYAPVKGRKEIGYMYGDNKVTLASGGYNDYVPATVSYTDNRHAPIIWDGMLSALNQWVREKNAAPANNYTTWFRPITDSINGDLPVLGFPENTAMATVGANNKVLRYSELDTLLATYSDQNANLFLYGNATGVKHVPTADEHVFVNENSVLLQDPSAGDFTNTTVGITFDNSNRNAQDYFGQTLYYDWHLMATPLSNARIGTWYSHKDGDGNYTPDVDFHFQDSPVDITGMVNSYFPNDLPMESGYNDGRVQWDFFSYFEPEYHWINLKRNKKNHFHFETIEDEVLDRPYQLDLDLGFPFRHYQVNYTEADQADNEGGDLACVFIPGKGYMMAISQDSYLNSTGTLNRGDVTIPITALAHSDYIDVSSNLGSNLLGNPYQAYLNLDTVAYANPKLNKFWVYDADVTDGAVQGLYKPYSPGASKNPDLPSRYLHPHQGFFVVYQPGTGDTTTIDMNFHYYMATTDTTAYSYFRGAIDAQPTYPLVNLYVTDEAGNADLTIVEFNRPETGGVPKIENLRNADFRLYARFDQGDYGLLFTPENTERVPVFFKTPDNGTYTMSWNKHNGHFRTMRLIDNIAGVDYDMLTHDHYTFDATSTDYAARFYIVFSVDNEEPQGDDGEIFAFFNGHGWVVSGAGQLELVDMLGHVLYANTLDGESTLVHFSDVAAGTYLLRLVSGNTVLKTQKLVIY